MQEIKVGMSKARDEQPPTLVMVTYTLILIYLFIILFTLFCDISRIIKYDSTRAAP